MIEKAEFIHAHCLYVHWERTEQSKRAKKRKRCRQMKKKNERCQTLNKKKLQKYSPEKKKWLCDLESLELLFLCIFLYCIFFFFSFFSSFLSVIDLCACISIQVCFTNTFLFTPFIQTMTLKNINSGNRKMACLKPCSKELVLEPGIVYPFPVLQNMLVG